MTALSCAFAAQTLPGMPMQATAQLEKGESPGVFNGTIRPTGQGEWLTKTGRGRTR
ncbi:MAG: hypothetical protein M3Y82_04540 [Verrucomicrobiota bacterium]|nr:hypothetical protein [Verrucomicrobiota bacterium]